MEEKPTTQNAKTPGQVRWGKVALLLVIPGFLLGLVLLMTSLAVDESDFKIASNLSYTLAEQSGRPKIAAISDTVVLVWSDGANADVRTKSIGSIYLKSATEIGNYWRFKVPVFEATSSVWGVEPDFVVDVSNPDLIHVVWAEGIGCEFSSPTDIGCNGFPTIRYASCNISSDLNTCTEPMNVITDEDFNFRAPTLAQDENGNLHVAWLRSPQGGDTLILYSRGVLSGTERVWNGGGIVQDTGDGQDAQLAYLAGRLHLIWDFEPGSANPEASQIRYIYDDIVNNDFFTTTLGTPTVLSNLPNVLQGETFNQANPGNPSMVVETVTFNGAPQNWVLVAFDLLDLTASGNEEEDPTFGLAFIESQFNGSSWPPSARSVPFQQTRFLSEYRSETQEQTEGLQPSLLLTTTQTATDTEIWAHLVWHEKVSQGEEDNYQVYYAYLTEPVNPNVSWQSAITVTLPEVTPTPTEVIIDDPRPNPRTLRPNGLNGLDSIGPGLAVSGSGTAHSAYLERQPGVPRSADVYYQGVIAGTIDPAYITNEVDLTVRANPTFSSTIQPVFPSIQITYTIKITNSGPLDAVQLGLTTTLRPGGIITYNLGSLETSFGEAALLQPRDIITWFGTLPSQSTLAITVTATTAPVTGLNNIIATGEIWNRGSRLLPIGQPRSEVILREVAQTTLSQNIDYLPLVFK